MSISMEELPILQFQEQIVEAVAKNRVVVVIADTGSGKSTKLAQILHGVGYTKTGCIAVTQPRKIAAVAVSWRVAKELNVRLGEEVGYAIRFEEKTSKRTIIKYLTDGVLLRESLCNPQLRQYSVIILDEAHERSLNMDVLLGLMKKLITMPASNLKVLVTSATLDGEKVSKFFQDCPIINVPGKLFPVDILYSLKTPTNYIEACLEKAIEIHTQEPQGDILIFVTGQEDINTLILQLKKRIRELEKGTCLDAIVWPFHASMPPEDQAIVLAPPPDNCRRFIVSTNIAETSLTVNGVVYVIDSGFVKEQHYNPLTGFYSLDVVKISKVQANQRAGRAGRTGPGKCYRMYTSAAYEDDFPDVTIPEIQRSSLAGSILYLKSLDLPDIDILKFDFLDRPSVDALEDALKHLYVVDAIHEDGSITRRGRLMSVLPLDPSLSRTLIEAKDLGCLSQAITTAAMLSVEKIFLISQSKTADKKRKRNASSLGDHIELLQIFENWHKTGYDVQWCKENNLQIKGMRFAKDIRKQLCKIMKIDNGPMDVEASSDENYISLRKALCAGYGNHVAERDLRNNGFWPRHIHKVIYVHPSSAIDKDEDGNYPNCVIYQKVSGEYMINVCAVSIDWLQSTFSKIQNFNVKKLSQPKKEEKDADTINRIQAARKRYFDRTARKTSETKKARKRKSI